MDRGEHCTSPKYWVAYNLLIPDVSKLSIPSRKHIRRSVNAFKYPLLQSVSHKSTLRTTVYHKSANNCTSVALSFCSPEALRSVAPKIWPVCLVD